MADTLLAMSEQRWRKLHAHHWLPLVRAQVTCVDGVQQRSHDGERAKDAA
jgi:hypothetical protein